jgi:hypothetical protein
VERRRRAVAGRIGFAAVFPYMGGRDAFRLPDASAAKKAFLPRRL